MTPASPEAQYDINKEVPRSGASSPAIRTAFTAWVKQPFLKGRGCDLAKVVDQHREKQREGSRTHRVP